MKSTTRTCGAAIALLSLCLAGAVHAGGSYYRWTDENGITVNSDRPPAAGVDYQVINTTVKLVLDESEQEEAAPAAAGPAPAQPAAQDSTPAPHQASQKDPKACEDARQNLVTLSTHARIRISDGEGSSRYLNEDEKAAQRTQAESAIEVFCE